MKILAGILIGVVTLPLAKRGGWWLIQKWDVWEAQKLIDRQKKLNMGV